MSFSIDSLPGYRRRFRITPEAARVACALEDDIHCMVVEVHHDGEKAVGIEAEMKRAPWTTCPGAEQQLVDTFLNVPLAEFARRGQKKANCTHLYDLAMLAAAHAFDPTPLTYDILVSDPREGVRQAELRCGERCIVQWSESDMVVVEPAPLEGMNLMGDLTPWIADKEADYQEAVRLLRWACMVAHGRQIPFEDQSDATKMPASCYTFQPERAVIASRVGIIKDFSSGEFEPLEGV